MAQPYNGEVSYIPCELGRCVCSRMCILNQQSAKKNNKKNKIKLHTESAICKKKIIKINKIKLHTESAICKKNNY